MSVQKYITLTNKPKYLHGKCMTTNEGISERNFLRLPSYFNGLLVLCT